MLEFDEMSTDELWTALPEMQGIDKGRLLMHLMSRNEANHEHSAAVTLAQQAAEVFDQEGFDREYANAKAFEGDAHMKLSEHDEAFNCYQDAISRLDEILDAGTIAAIQVSLGDNEEARHNFIGALAHYIDAVAISQNEENWEEAVSAQAKVTKLMIMCARPDEQISEAQKFYDLAKKADNSHAIMQALYATAIASDNNEDFDKAIKFGKDALIVARSCTCDRCVPEMQEILGTIYLHDGKVEKAEKLIKSSIKNFRKNGYARAAVFSKAQLGQVYLVTNPKKAKKIFKEIMVLSEHVENVRGRISAGSGLAKYYEITDQPKKAIQLYEELIPFAFEYGKHKNATQLKLRLCELLIKENNPIKAREVFRDISPIFLGKPAHENNYQIIKSKL